MRNKVAEAKQKPFCTFDMSKGSQSAKATTKCEENTSLLEKISGQFERDYRFLALLFVAIGSAFLALGFQFRAQNDFDLWRDE